MENLKKLIEKRIKLKPWLICGIILFFIAIVCLLVATPFMAKTNIVWVIIPIVALLLIGLIPYMVLDRIDSKISQTLAEITKNKIFDFMGLKGFYYDEEVQIEINCKRTQAVYLLEVFVKNISADFIALAVSNVTKEICSELKYTPHIKSTISKML